MLGDPGVGKGSASRPLWDIVAPVESAEEGSSQGKGGGGALETSLAPCAILRTLIIPVPRLLAAHERGLTEDGI